MVHKMQATQSLYAGGSMVHKMQAIQSLYAGGSMVHKMQAIQSCTKHNAQQLDARSYAYLTNPTPSETR